ncbi:MULTISPECIES: aliphatic sulfonate ABC transporter substrate-binding protein [unclassified Rhizobium]|uniref:aliphatic sulfonate ABC transporter substrate-binding protein n=1 Tax=Rhizobium sp. N4311 TaxID=1703972 RepID=UPI001F004232|nr:MULTISPECIES: aliphatic sulfonate ABC transporter substrate-binding protein [unclassified Rhizobium]
MALSLFAGLVAVGTARAADISEIRVDWATYNPVSLILKDEGILEKEFEKDGIKITWVQSAGSNKALEFLNAGSLDFGSTAGAAALIGRVNGNPIKSIYVYSRPEWTALVTRKDTGIAKVEDLKGKSIAVTRGTDPHIFLVRALADAGLTEKDVSLVLLQHADGRLALKRGDVDAWAGLDPIMASAEIEDGDVLFYRKPENNSWGVLNVREEFAAAHPEIVKRVLASYEKARSEALKDPAKLKAALVAATKLPDSVIERQLERTNLGYSVIGDSQRETIEAAGLALQKADVIKADVDVKQTVSALIDPSYASAALGQ